MGGRKRGSAGAAALQTRGGTRCEGQGALQVAAAVCAVPAPGLRLSVGGEEQLPQGAAARRLCRRRPSAVTGAEAKAAAGSEEEAAAAGDQRPLLRLAVAAAVAA